MTKELIKSWYVYIILCADDSFYTGITTDLEKRLAAHQSGKGARYTKSHGAKKIIYSQQWPDRAAASRRELEIKRLSRTKKEFLIANENFS